MQPNDKTGGAVRRQPEINDPLLGSLAHLRPPPAAAPPASSGNAELRAELAELRGMIAQLARQQSAPPAPAPASNGNAELRAELAELRGRLAGGAQNGAASLAPLITALTPLIAPLLERRADPILERMLDQQAEMVKDQQSRAEMTELLALGAEMLGDMSPAEALAALKAQK